MSRHHAVTGTAPGVSVIICAYTLERWDLLTRALASATHQTYEPHEVILVIDHNDDLLAAARREFTGVRVVTNDGERGLSGARNTGWSQAEGDVVAFLDDDAVAMPNWLERLVESYADPHVAAVGGTIVPEWAAGEATFLPEEFWWVVGCTYKGVPNELSPVRNMLGANMSMRRSVLGRVGGFDSSLGRIGKRPVGCEETELCIRIRARDADAMILNEPSAVVHHHVPSERTTWRYFLSRCYAEGLSKARVAQLQGSAVGLSSERSYVVRTMTSGVIDIVRQSVARRRPALMLRLVSIVIGVMWTAAGFTVGTVAIRRPGRLTPAAAQ